MPGSLRPRKSWRAALAVLIVLGVSYLVLSNVGLPRQSILPGFEGEQNGIWGYQVRNSPATVIGGPLPVPSGACSYSFSGSPSITSESVKVTSPQGIFSCAVLTATDAVTVDAQENPVSQTNPYTVGQTVSYYTPVPNQAGKTQYDTGQVEVYSYSLDFSVQSGSSGNWNFGGDTAWFNLYSLVWNQASTDPNNSSVSGSTFETPLYAVVSNVQWQNQGSSQLDAGIIGHALTFYSSPSTTGQTLATLANPTTQNVNTSLNSQYAPDSRFQRLVYYPVTLGPVFQANCGILGCGTYPSVTVTITLYTLRIGEYILTNPSTTGLGSRSQGCVGLGCVSQYFNGLADWLANPFNQALTLLGLGSLGVIAAVVIIAVFATPLLIAFIYALSNRRKKKL